MGKKKPPKVSFPEMDTLLEGMQGLLVDEFGNPLPPDHPQVKRVQTFMDQIASTVANKENEGLTRQPHGHA